jgi:RNA polymerase sigma-70 factor (ECF subfamily)
VGSWLPEPIATSPAVSADAGLADSLSMAMLLVLESLKPVERAVFVLHDVFGFALTEIAQLTGKTDTAVRQIAHRSRAHVQARRRRFDPDPELADQIVRQFLVASHTGDLQSLMDVLAPDVVQISDGGGRVAAARRPIRGGRAVGQFCIGVARTSPALRVEFKRCNAMPAAVFWDGDDIYQALLFDIADGRIHGVYAVRNPAKLGNAKSTRDLVR